MAVGTCRSGANGLGRLWGMIGSARPSPTAISRHSSRTCKPSSNKGNAMPWEPIHPSAQSWDLPPNLLDADIGLHEARGVDIPTGDDGQLTTLADIIRYRS